MIKATPMIKNLMKLDKPNIFYKKSNGNAFAIIYEDDDFKIIGSKKVLDKIKNIILTNTEYKEPSTFNQCVIYTQLCFDSNFTGSYILNIEETSIDEWKDLIDGGEITINEVEELNTSLINMRKWLIEYIEKNFKKLTDEEKLYIELEG